MNVKDLIIDELMRLPKKRVMRSNIAICCPFHDDKSPSFYINTDETNRNVPLGYGHCFSESCPKKSANWNEIAEKLGLKTIKVRKSDGKFNEEYVRPINDNMRNSLLGKTTLTMESIEKEFHCNLALPIEKDDVWRNMPGNLLRKIGCTVAVDKFDNKCLIIPVWVEGDLVGAVKAMWTKPESKKLLSYVNLRGEWIREKGLFPYDYVEKMIKKRGLDYVVLVEGQRDALRLITLGIPALAILGTKNWSKQKRNLVLSLPVDKVVVMMDADAAGIAASNTVMKDLKGRTHRIQVKLAEIQKNLEKKKGRALGENLDPGNCPEKILLKLASTF